MYEYKDEQLFKMGQVYHILNDLRNNGEGYMADQADAYPFKYIITCFHGLKQSKIPNRVNNVIMSIMDGIGPEELTSVMNTIVPLDMRMSWHLGYQAAYKLMEPHPIEKHRKEKNMTQKELADSLEIAPRNISLWENGETKPNLENLQKLASIFGLSMDEFTTELYKA